MVRRGTRAARVVALLRLLFVRSGRRAAGSGEAVPGHEPAFRIDDRLRTAGSGVPGGVGSPRVRFVTGPVERKAIREFGTGCLRTGERNDLCDERFPY
ncbi:hypothetical protein GCM10023320_73120 [Pseudonocardia adelaidensis]|uniref:Secreted protein n=1 Tax=Pseudonocardia adelaidensis TaxID=648754 RepID=A0ABP9P779_9PSEU